jgi:Peptidase S24-like
MLDPVFRNVQFLPGTIHAGFLSPASDYEERELDINDLVVPHPTTSYFMRVSGDSMTGACIYSDCCQQPNSSCKNWRGVYAQTVAADEKQENLSQAGKSEVSVN